MSFALTRGMTMKKVAAWTSVALCSEVDVAPAVASKTLPVSVQGAVPRAHARRLLEAALAAGDVELAWRGGKLTLDELKTVAPAGCDEPREAAIVAAIQAVSPTERRIARSVWTSAWTDCATGSARVVPSFRDGKPNGFKVFAIRAKSLWAAAGFQNGDTWLSVNGMPLDGPDKALEAYAQVRKASRFTVELERAGKPVTLTFTVVDDAREGR